MATNLEYALMAGVAYRSTRNEINRFPIPTSSGWSEILGSHRNLDASGFEAIAFQNGTDIVISYAGTNGDGGGISTNPDKQASIVLALGTGSAQLLQAAEYYLKVKAANTVNGVAPNITLTGHSLGGGLAALVGVFFGVEARTFDQAPFAQTALFKAADLKAELVSKGLYSVVDLAPLTSYIAQQDAALHPHSTIPNAGLVTDISVQGELLSGVPYNFANRIGSTTETISNSAPGVSGDDLHAQVLLAAFLQSRQTAASGRALNEVTVKLPDLLKMIFDKNLFAYTTASSNDKNENLLERLVRHEAGVRDPATGATTIPADAMLTRFTVDLWKIAQDGGLTLSNKNLTDALTAFAMQFYYTDAANATNPDKHLFDSTGVSGGLHFDRNDVAATLAEAKGYTRYFVNYLATLPPTERLFITQQLPDLRDWYIQAGSDALNATAGTQRAFLLGGTAAQDMLTDSDGNDQLWRLRDTRKSYAKRYPAGRRWRHGAKALYAANETTWRRAA